MQHQLKIHSLPQEWLWCETWCSDESLGQAKTIDLCNNPQTKEPKLERARRQVPEWTVYDEEIAEVLRKAKEVKSSEEDEGNGDGDQRGGGPKLGEGVGDELEGGEEEQRQTGRDVKDEL